MSPMLRVLVLFGVVLAPACAGPAPPASTAPAALAATPPQVLAALDSAAQAWNRGDVDGYMAHHVNSPELTVVGGSGPVRGWEEIRAAYRRGYFAEGTPGRHVHFSQLRVEPLDGDRAVVHGVFQYLDPSTREKVGQGWMTLVLVRTPGGWKIAHRHNS